MSRNGNDEVNRRDDRIISRWNVRSRYSRVGNNKVRRRDDRITGR